MFGVFFAAMLLISMFALGFFLGAALFCIALDKQAPDLYKEWRERRKNL